MTGHQPPRRASFPEVARTVLAGFFGVRRRVDHERDTGRISPLQVVGIGIAFAALFVFSLITVVHFVVAG